MAKDPIKPIKDHQMREAQIIQLAVTICALGSCKFTQRHIHPALPEIVIHDKV